MNNEWVKDPKVFNINREKAHASIHRYASLEEMHTNKSSYIYSLNGKWKFHYANGFNQLIKDFSNKDYNSDNWDEINVPGHIQLQGYGTPMYVNRSILGLPQNKLYQERFQNIIQLAAILLILIIQLLKITRMFILLLKV